MPQVAYGWCLEDVARVSVCRKKLASANAKASRDSSDKADCRASHSLRVQKLIQGSPRLLAGRLFFVLLLRSSDQHHRNELGLRVRVPVQRV